MRKVNIFPIDNKEQLILVSFLHSLEYELKYIAKKTNDYFIYDKWKEKEYTSLTTNQLIDLKKLDLSCIGLKTIPDELRYLQNLEELNLSGNNLQELPDGIFTLKNLKVLNLGDIINGGNKLQSISKDIEKLTKLEVLKLIWNDELMELPKEILNLKNLDYISLSQRAILETNVGKELEETFCVDFEDFYN